MTMVTRGLGRGAQGSMVAGGLGHRGGVLAELATWFQSSLGWVRAQEMWFNKPVDGWVSAIEVWRMSGTGWRKIFDR